MPWAIMDGTGSLRIKDTLIKAGATWVDDPDVVEILESGRYHWVILSETRDLVEPELPSTEGLEPEPEAPEEPYELFEGRDNRFYYLRPSGPGQPFAQSQGYDTREDAEEAVEADREEAGKVALAGEADDSHESGPLVPSELTDTEFECRADGCEKTFRSTGARKNHERIFHRNLSQAPDVESEQ